MKILMTSDTYLPQIGGAEIHVLNIRTRLRNRGDKVRLVVTEGTIHVDDDPDIVRVPWAKKNLFRILLILWREVGAADIVHSHYCYRLAFFSTIVATLRGKPSVVVLHGLGLLPEAGAKGLPKLGHALYRQVSLSLATKVISTSEDLAVFAEQFIAGRKIVTIPNGYDEIAFSESSPIPPDIIALKKNGGPIILTVRRLVPKNGIQYLVEAMPYILKKIPNARHLVVGDGRIKDEIRARVKILGLERCVQFFGKQTNDKIPGFLRIADVVVFPSTAESTSIACAEAFAVGTPVVASAVGGLVELVGKTEERGRLVSLVPWTVSSYEAPAILPQDRYEELARVIIAELQSKDDGRRRRASEYARTRLAWSIIAEKTRRVLEALV